MSLASAGAIGSWGGPVGAGIVVLSAAGLILYRDAQDKAKFEAPSRDLEAGGYDPEVASMLANYDNNDDQSARPAIAATARQFGIDPGTLMQRLNAMPADKVEKLVRSAPTVNPNSRGEYQLTASNDRQVWGPEGKDPQYGGHYLYDLQDTAYRGGYDIVVGSPFPVAGHRSQSAQPDGPARLCARAAGRTRAGLSSVAQGGRAAFARTMKRQLTKTQSRSFVGWPTQICLGRGGSCIPERHPGRQAAPGSSYAGDACYSRRSTPSTSMFSQDRAANPAVSLTGSYSVSAQSRKPIGARRLRWM
jgi:hypothetical protein